MERVVGVAVNDANLLTAFAEARAGELDVTGGATGAAWALGFHGHGELLVHRAPIGTPWRLAPALERVRARHLVLVGDDAPDRRRAVADRQPYRYRDWLFAAAGAKDLGAGFVAAAQAELGGTAFGTKRAAAPSEALMMVIVGALGQLRATHSLTTDAVRAAIGVGVARADALAGDALAAPALLHTEGYLYGLALGRPLHVQRVAGLGRERRGFRHAHFRGALVTDRPVEEGEWEVVAPGRAVEIGVDGGATVFSL